MTGAKISVAAILIEIHCDRNAATVAFASNPEIKTEIALSDIQSFEREESADAASGSDASAA